MGATVRPATPDDLSYIVSLGKREYEAIGFIPASRYESIITGVGDVRPSHRLWIAEENGDRVGFLYATPGEAGGSLKVVQVCVQEDARRLEYGAALVSEAERHAVRVQRGAVSLTVAVDLDASLFWEAEGYRLASVDRGGKRRGRLLERRYKRLPLGLWIAEDNAS